MKHVLLVGVDDDRLQPLVQQLNDVHLHRALNTPGALEQVRRQKDLALLITPAWSQDIDGFQIVLAAREYIPEARVVVLTEEDGSQMPLISEHCIAHYVDRDTDTDALLELVRASLSNLTDVAGRLDDLELMDIAVLACLSKRSAVLHIHHNTDKGQITFHDGQIAHASFRDLEGRPALFELLALQQGDIFMQNRVEELVVSIEETWKDLLTGGFLEIEGRRLALTQLGRASQEDPSHKDAITDTDVAALLGLEDYPDPVEEQPHSGEFFSSEELREFEDTGAPPVIEEFDEDFVDDPFPPDPNTDLSLELPPEALSHSGQPRYAAQQPHTRPAPRAAAAAAVASVAPPPLQAPQMPLHDLLERLELEIPEFQGTQLVHLTDGLSIASLHTQPHFDDASCAAFYSDYFNACLRAVHGYGLPPSLEESLITTEHHYILLRALRQTPFLHLVIMGRAGNLGIAKVLMRQFEPELIRALPQ